MSRIRPIIRWPTANTKVNSCPSGSTRGSARSSGAPWRPGASPARSGGACPGLRAAAAARGHQTRGLLDGSNPAINTHVEMMSEVLLPQAAVRGRNYPAGIRKTHADASRLIANLVIKAVEISRLGDVALHGRRARSENGGGRIEFCLPAAREVNARAFLHENLRPCQADPRVSTRDDSDLSIEFRHFLPQAHRLNHAVFQDAAFGLAPLLPQRCAIRGIAVMRSRGPAQLRSGRRGDGCAAPAVARRWQREPRSAGTGQAVAPTRNAPRRAFRRRDPA